MTPVVAELKAEIEVTTMVPALTDVDAIALAMDIALRIADVVFIKSRPPRLRHDRFANDIGSAEERMATS